MEMRSYLAGHKGSKITFAVSYCSQSWKPLDQSRKTLNLVHKHDLHILYSLLPLAVRDYLHRHAGALCPANQKPAQQDEQGHNYNPVGILLPATPGLKMLFTNCCGYTGSL
jgi:hypothetical protein